MYYLQELGILLGGCLIVKNLVWIFLGIYNSQQWKRLGFALR